MLCCSKFSRRPAARRARSAPRRSHHRPLECAVYQSQWSELRHEYACQARSRQRHAGRGHAAALRHCRQLVRRPRRGDQHHASHHPGAGRRGDPSRPQPLGGRRGARGAAGRRRRNRAVVLSGRPRRVLQVHGRHAARARRRPRARVWRRRRHHHAGRDQGTAGLRRRAHLSPERRHEARPHRDDRRRDGARRHRCRRAHAE